MKKLYFVFLFVLLSLFICTPAFANDPSMNTIREYFADGSYIEITVTPIPARSNNGYRKTTTYCSSDDEKLWSYTLTASFQYDGKAVKCISVTDSYEIYNNAWSCDSHSVLKNGSTSSGTITMKQKILGITAQTITRGITITCDKNGTIS